jgi:hypothetical protein
MMTYNGMPLNQRHSVRAAPASLVSAIGRADGTL